LQALHCFEPDQVHARWTPALDRRGSDPAGAIKLARTLAKDVCRWMLAELEVEAADSDELPVLYRKLSKALQLAQDDHSEQVFKQILGIALTSSNHSVPCATSRATRMARGPGRSAPHRGMPSSPST